MNTTSYTLPLGIWDDSPRELEIAENKMGVKVTVSLRPCLDLDVSSYGYGSAHKEAIQNVRSHIVLLGDTIRALRRNFSVSDGPTIHSADDLEDLIHYIEKQLWPLCIMEPGEFNKLREQALSEIFTTLLDQPITVSKS
jgi:hypothetical protein